mmetsp:Transcript_109422/g.205235  ORF Transcript_109422/g.205235 Transcript_109422/m.205235 type:complete len:202 (+) Transcript_109422:3379-3984(+)
MRSSPTEPSITKKLSRSHGISTRRTSAMLGSRRKVVVVPSSMACLPIVGLNALSAVVTKSFMASWSSSRRMTQSVQGAPPMVPRLAAAAKACVSGGLPLKKRKREKAMRALHGTREISASTRCNVCAMSFRKPSLMTKTLKAPPADRTSTRSFIASAINVVLPRSFTPMVRSSDTVGSRPAMCTLSAMLSNVMRTTGSSWR